MVQLASSSWISCWLLDFLVAELVVQPASAGDTARVAPQRRVWFCAGLHHGNGGMAYLKVEFYYEIPNSLMANRPWTAAI